MIKEITKYVTMGREFDSLEKAEQYRLDLIGSKIVDKLPILLGPGDAIKVADWLAENRKEVIKLLDY